MGCNQSVPEEDIEIQIINPNICLYCQQEVIEKKYAQCFNCNFKFHIECIKDNSSKCKNCKTKYSMFIIGHKIT